MISMRRVYSGQPGVTDTLLYTCPANTKARVLKCTATNDTTFATTITFNLVPSGGSVGDGNLITNADVIGDSETSQCPEVVGQVLNSGDALYAKAEDADQVSVTLAVAEQS